MVIVISGIMKKEKEITHLQWIYYADVTAFETERTMILSLEEIEEGTNHFDETKIIGQGGYGSVYYGMLGEKVWPVFAKFLYFQ